MWVHGDTPDHDVYPGSNYIGAFNEPYGESQANMTFQEILDNWPRFLEKVQELADGRNLPVSEIQIGSPTLGPGKKAMTYGEEFMKFASENNLQIDFMNIHSYTTGIGGDCSNYLQLRDEISHLRFKWGKPIWLTEYNCGDGYWKWPVEHHIPYMQATLPMLEEHPWVVRYNWMSALAEYPGAELNDKTDSGKALTELGQMYNEYVWDGIPRQNPQWG